MLFDKISKIFGPNKENIRVFRDSDILALLLLHFSLLLVFVYVFSSTFTPFYMLTLKVLLFPWLFACFLSALDLSTLLISFLWLSITVCGQVLLSSVPVTCSVKLYKPYSYENYFYLQESLPLSVSWLI